MLDRRWAPPKSCVDYVHRNKGAGVRFVTDRTPTSVAFTQAQQEAVMTEKVKSEVISRRSVFSLLGLAIASGLVATSPVSPQVSAMSAARSLARADDVIE